MKIATRALVVFLLLSPAYLNAARIGDISETDLFEQVIRFFSFQDPSLRYALMGSILLGISCGIMGSFLVVRKLALMGDALSHAVLPGVALGFLWNMNKDPVAIFVGAVFVGLLGAGTVQLIKNTTKQKEDAALGFVLASFFGVGICMMTMIQNMPGGSKSGLDKFMFGQAAAMGRSEVILLAVVTGIILMTVSLFYKEFKVCSFDAGFARSYGLPVNFFHYSLMLLLAFAIVSALQAVGVVLVSAMLIIPAATAYLLTDRLGWMLVLSALFGFVAGSTGSFFSFVGRNMPTGPFMVLAAGFVFCIALFFGPRYGIVNRWWRQKSRAGRIQRENSLKAIYHVLEKGNFREDTVTIREFCQHSKLSLEEGKQKIMELRRSGFVNFRNDVVVCSPSGWQRACEIVRNHRLWELYLTNEAQMAADHVHEDAEKVEHVLGEDVVRRLERMLDYATEDPHGKLIPGIRDVHSGYYGGLSGRTLGKDNVVGYGPKMGGSK